MKEVTEYSYDELGRESEVVVTTEKFVETTTTEYDKLGRVSRRTVVIEELPAEVTWDKAEL